MLKSGVIDLKNQTALESTIGTDTTRIYTYDDGSTVHLMVTKDDAGTETQVKLAEQSSITNLSAKGAGYYFDGVNDITTISGLSAIGTDDFSVFATISPMAGGYIIGSAGTGDGFGLTITSTAALQVYKVNVSPVTASTNTVSVTGQPSSIGYIRSGTSGTYYINGKTDDVTDNKDYTAAIGCLGSFRSTVPGSYYTGGIENFLFFNTAITDEDERAQIALGNIPNKYIGASQTELMPNQVDRDFSGASAWADVDLVSGSGAYDETGDLTITAGAAGAGDYCTCPVLSVPTTIGKVYRLTYDYTVAVAGAWTIKDFTGVQTIGTISATATQGILEWTATTTGGLRIVAATNDVSGTFDNFTLTQIGAVAAYLPEGIGHYSWMDNSGNGLHGTNSGAIPFGLNIGDTRTAYLLTTSEAPTMTDVQKGGWKVKSIAMETAQNLTEIDCTQETSSIELLSDKTLNNGKMVWCTLADHMLYAAGTDKDLVFKLTGNGGDGTKIYVELEKVF
jgi:hypothetical protein